MAKCFQLRIAAHWLRQGEVLAYPTEAIYGLGCDPLNPQAVHRLLQLKQRPAHKGLILIGATYQQILPFIQPLDKTRMQPVLNSWPGPYTWLLPAAPATPGWITGGSDRVAVRVTQHHPAAQLCRQFGGALVSTSANRSAQPPAKSPLEVRLRCPEIQHILHGPLGTLSHPTMIRNALTGEVLRA